MGERTAEFPAPARWLRAACWLGLYLAGAELALLALPRVAWPGAMWHTIEFFPIGFFDWLVVGFTPFVIVTHNSSSFFLTQMGVGYLAYIGLFACTLSVSTRRAFRRCLFGLVVLAAMTIAGGSLVTTETVSGSINDESPGLVEIHVLNRVAR